MVEKDEAKRAKLYEDMQRHEQMASPIAVLFQRSEQPAVRKGRRRLQDRQRGGLGLLLDRHQDGAVSVIAKTVGAGR